MNLFEGGNVFKDADGNPLTQRINQTDVPSTVTWLEQLTGLEFPRERWLGSTGKAPTSGDLDLAVDASEISKEQLASKLEAWARSHGEDPRTWVKKSGEVHLRTPITGRPELGYVQTDFMFFPNLDWGTFFYNQTFPSAYKGMHRAILMSSIAKTLGLRIGANGMFSRATNELVSQDPDYVARAILGPKATREDLGNVESIYAFLARDKDRDAKLRDFRDQLARDGLKEPTQLEESGDVYFLARLRDRIVNQGMYALVEAAKPPAADAPVGGRAKGIEHLEDYIFRNGTAGVKTALAIVDNFKQDPKTASVKWDGKPAVVFGRKPDTGEFVLTDGAGFEAVGYDGLFTSPQAIKANMAQRDASALAKGNVANRVETLLPVYQAIWPYLEAATPTNFCGYVKGDLLYITTPPVVAGNVEFKPNTVEYRIPVKSKLGTAIANSEVGVAVHTMYEDAGAAKQPLARVKFNPVPGLLLIEPIYAKPVEIESPYVKKIKSLLRTMGPAIDTLFNPAELRAMKITDLAKLCVDYINRRINPEYPAYTGDFSDLVPGFMNYLKSTQTPQKFRNITEYLRSPSSNEGALAAAFVLFELLHDLKLDLLGKLDAQVPGNEGWVFATPAGYGKAVNRFDFTARNKLRNNPTTT